MSTTIATEDDESSENDEWGLPGDENRYPGSEDAGNDEDNGEDDEDKDDEDKDDEDKHDEDKDDEDKDDEDKDDGNGDDDEKRSMDVDMHHAVGKAQEGSDLGIDEANEVENRPDYDLTPSKYCARAFGNTKGSQRGGWWKPPQGCIKRDHNTTLTVDQDQESGIQKGNISAWPTGAFRINAIVVIEARGRIDDSEAPDGWRLTEHRVPWWWCALEGEPDMLFKIPVSVVRQLQKGLKSSPKYKTNKLVSAQMAGEYIGDDDHADEARDPNKRPHLTGSPPVFDPSVLPKSEGWTHVARTSTAALRDKAKFEQEDAKQTEKIAAKAIKETEKAAKKAADKAAREEIKAAKEASEKLAKEQANAIKEAAKMAAKAEKEAAKAEKEAAKEAREAKKESEKAARELKNEIDKSKRAAKKVGVAAIPDEPAATDKRSLSDNVSTNTSKKKAKLDTTATTSLSNNEPVDSLLPDAKNLAAESPFVEVAEEDGSASMGDQGSSADNGQVTTPFWTMSKDDELKFPATFVKFVRNKAGEVVVIITP